MPICHSSDTQLIGSVVFSLHNRNELSFNRVGEEALNEANSFQNIVMSAVCDNGKTKTMETFQTLLYTVIRSNDIVSPDAAEINEYISVCIC